MYTREENYHYKTRKNSMNTPSFSSTLLDEIYRSIDGGAAAAEKPEGFNEKPLRKQGGGGCASVRRVCLVEKWMEKEANENVVAKKTAAAALLPELDNNDLLFFSSTSSSSDSSGALSSSSETEFFGSSSTKKPPKVSCFSSTRPKPVRTGATTRVETKPQKDNRFLFDDYNNNSNKKNQDHQKSKTGDDLLIKSKSRALKIYANLKKVKQPISPGGKLTSFINSFFTNGNNVINTKIQDSSKSSPKASSTTCSSASSFSRSCLSKYSPKSREKIKNGVQRSVRFNPVSVVVDQDLRPCGQKPVYERPPLPPNSLAKLKFSKMEKNIEVEDAAKNVLRGYCSKNGDNLSLFRKICDEQYDDEDDDDAMSDSSSDLFELDHLAFFGDKRFCEELPVYETTRLDTNRGVVSRLVR
ncbi:hypothetical protein ABFS82_01G009000 [Erythranthe guttata]|uniref:Protein BIG GRAIN 1-like B n=1 Tax=Erythranthe guttata TaxID=4155 RepID=A0A022PV88_ERYGU|nr:PREDICTED: uncharacterized protein LOC105977271 [Erythranthe guttata]EYU20312.1 hypothetical protein MIMGU_mgv1a007281mg [Erythranthe guttata]|eukprot:XP_012858032.1 PREDICTED: uncharacterized protein LOC105977271 [Erythranthe guttata]